MDSDQSIEILKDLTSKVQVTQFLNSREYLQALYEAMKARLKSYSYLRFANDLGFSATNVIRLIIIGKRPLTKKTASKIANSLSLKHDQLRYWIALVRYNLERSPQERDALLRTLMEFRAKEHPHELNALEVEYFSSWYHPIIREMVALPDFQGDPEWIQKRLNIPLRLEIIKRSLSLLHKLKVIDYDAATNCYKRSGNIKTPSEVDHIALISYHQQMIKIGQESITKIDETLRDIQAVTINIPVSAIPLIKGKIQEFISEALAIEAHSIEKSGNNEVIQLNIQMFPVTSSKSTKSQGDYDHDA